MGVTIVSELSKRTFPFITGVRFHDDTFVARPIDQLREFRDAYSQRIGLPFACYAHPADVTEDKIRILCDAGLGKVGMGIESGSRRLLKLYRRGSSNAKVLAAACVLHRFSDEMSPPWYDMIVDYFNETEADAIESFHLLEQLPVPHTLHVFSMVLWPGTELYALEKEKGTITDDEKQVYQASYNVHKPTYLTMVYYCFKSRNLVPRPIRKILSLPVIVHILNHPQLRWLYPALVSFLRRARHGFRPAPKYQVNA